ncbi:hypothetical protein ACQKM9_19610 [Viridibacillus sp. NPDC093762]|uniref:hypothetical protein n=1 Tax=Viridibacillus sp. NPDC093762 TaxID=3390720 RepID=UPI003D055167
MVGNIPSDLLFLELVAFFMFPISGSNEKNVYLFKFNVENGIETSDTLYMYKSKKQNTELSHFQARPINYMLYGKISLLSFI